MRDILVIKMRVQCLNGASKKWRTDNVGTNNTRASVFIQNLKESFSGLGYAIS